MLDGRLGEEEVLIWAAAAEAPSEHPLGRAVSAAAAARNLTVPEPQQVVSLPGRGVTAIVAGRRIGVARRGTLDGLLDGLPDGLPGSRRSQRQSLLWPGSKRSDEPQWSWPKTTYRSGCWPRSTRSDQVRPDAVTAVARLGQLTADPAVLLTGDGRQSAGRSGPRR